MRSGLADHPAGRDSLYPAKVVPVSSPATPRPPRPRPDPGPGSEPATGEGRKGPDAAWLFFLLPVLCCAGPAILAALAVASAAALGVARGVIGAVLLAVAAGLCVRHRRRADACCAPAGKARRR